MQSVLFFFSLVVSMGLLGGSQAVWAAREGLVALDETELYNAPSHSAPILGKLAQGNPVASSNFSIEGFYKVRTAMGMVGWIASDRLFLKPVPPLSDIEKAIRNLGINAKDGGFLPPEAAPVPSTVDISGPAVQTALPAVNAAPALLPTVDTVTPMVSPGSGTDQQTNLIPTANPPLP